MSIKRVITKKCECLVVNWQRALCYHMQWCREANLWRSALYNVETVFHEVPTNQPCPQIITWVWLKHYSSVFFVVVFFHKIVLSVRVIIAEGQIAASKAGLQALLPSFPSTLILTVEPGPRLLDTGRIVPCPLELHMWMMMTSSHTLHFISCTSFCYLRPQIAKVRRGGRRGKVTSSCWVLLGHMLHRGPSSCEIHHPSVRKIGPYANQNLYNFVAPNYK